MGAEIITAPASPTTLDRSLDSSDKPLVATRRFWFILHVVGFIPLSLLIVGAMSLWQAIVLVILVPLLELWLLLRSFPNQETRRSIRMAIACLMPVAMVFAITLAIVSNYHYTQYANYDQKAVLKDFDSAPQAGTIVRVAEGMKKRNDLSGSYWAPSDETIAWRMIPLVDEDWQSDMPIDLWVISTDRLDSMLIDQPLTVVKVTEDADDFRLSQAIADAELRHGIESAAKALVLEPVADPAKQLDSASGFVFLGFLICLLSWMISSILWPTEQPIASKSD
jgi:hypothetical protein